jgi:hypothetical protein
MRELLIQNLSGLGLGLGLGLDLAIDLGTRFRLRFRDNETAEPPVADFAIKLSGGQR